MANGNGRWDAPDERDELWLSWELWATLLDPGNHSPDSLRLLEDEVDVQQLPRSSPATPPQPGQGTEWRAFEHGEHRG